MAPPQVWSLRQAAQQNWRATRKSPGKCILYRVYSRLPVPGLWQISAYSRINAKEAYPTTGLVTRLQSMANDGDYLFFLNDITTAFRIARDLKHCLLKHAGHGLRAVAEQR